MNKWARKAARPVQKASPSRVRSKKTTTTLQIAKLLATQASTLTNRPQLASTASLATSAMADRGASATLVATVKMVAKSSVNQALTVTQLVLPIKKTDAKIANPVDTRSLEVRRLARNVMPAIIRPGSNKLRAWPAKTASSLATTVQREHLTPLIFHVKKAHTQTKVKRKVAKFARKDSISQ